jgi:hypothetical protein
VNIVIVENRTPSKIEIPLTNHPTKRKGESDREEKHTLLDYDLSKK